MYVVHWHGNFRNLSPMHITKLICIGIVNADFGDVRDKLISQLQEVLGSEILTCDFGVIDWKNFFRDDGLLYDVTKFQIALLPLRDRLTVYACNLADGWISLLDRLVSLNKFDAYFFRTTVSAHGQFEVFEMVAWQKGARKRHVRVLEDDKGWEFLNNGSPLPFKNTERYARTRIETRLDAELIDRYSGHVGYKISNIPAFNNPCELISRMDSGC